MTPTVTPTDLTTDTKGCFVAEKKRGNGEGSKPRKRLDGRWEARYTDAEGNRKSIYALTRKEVAKKLREAMARIEDVPAFAPSNITVGQFFEQYEDVVKDSMKRLSFETYQDIARLHLLPTLGSSNSRNWNVTTFNCCTLLSEIRDYRQQPLGVYTMCCGHPSTTQYAGD